jgi:hypothetical protein
MAVLSWPMIHHLSIKERKQKPKLFDLSIFSDPLSRLISASVAEPIHPNCHETVTRMRLDQDPIPISVTRMTMRILLLGFITLRS